MSISIEQIHESLLGVWGEAYMTIDPCCNSVENFGFPPREQLKGIVETVEVLAYKATPFAIDHFALECVGGCICRCMLEGVFVCVRECFSVSVLDF